MRIKSDKEHFLSCNVAAFTYNQGGEDVTVTWYLSNNVGK